MLSEYSVKKPYTVAVAVVIVIILGVMSFMGMTVDLTPSIDLPYVVVYGTYPGASPEEVEASLIKPLEQSLATVENMESIQSTSYANYGMVIVEFSQSADMNSVIIEINNNINMLDGRLPEGVSTPTVMKINPNSLPIMMSAVSVAGMDKAEASSYIENKIIPELESVEGVGAVSASGLYEETVHIKLNQDKIDDINLKMLDEVDSELASAARKLRAAKKQLTEGNTQVDSTYADKTAELNEAEKALSEGIAQVEKAEKDMAASTQWIEELKKMSDAVASGSTEYNDAMKDRLSELAAITNPSETELTELYLLSELYTAALSGTGVEAATEKINQAYAGVSDAKQQIADQKAQLISQLEQVTSGKAALSTQIMASKAQITNSLAEIEKGLAEIENSKEEALKNANINQAVSVSTISSILGAQSFSFPAGYISEDGQQYLIKVGDKITDTKDLSDLVLFSLGLDSVDKITLSDVADIEVLNNADDSYSKVNGKNAILLTFQKQSNSSTAEVSENILAEMEKLTEKNTDLEFSTLMDQGVYIKIVTDSVLQNLLYGAFLAIIVLLIFMKSVRPTIIIAISIPFSVVFAFVMMYFTGVTLNAISLSGLALGVGMLVDNSIVVIENIYRLRSEGVPVKEAVTNGAKQMGGAITASTLTTVCVFAPIIFTEGITRELFTDMGLTITFSLMASLVVALTVVPAMAQGLFRKPVRMYNNDSKILDTYEKILRRVLKMKPIVLIATVVLLVLSSIWAVSMGTSFMPAVNSEQMSVTLKFDENTETDDARTITDEAVSRIMTIEEIEDVGAMEGSSSTGSSAPSMSLYIILDTDNLHRSNQEIGADISEKLADLNCTVNVTASTMDISMLTGKGISISVSGLETDTLQSVSKELAAILEGIEGTKNVKDGLENADPEIRISVNKDKAMEYGLTVAQVYAQVAENVSESQDSITITAPNGMEYPVTVESAKNGKVTVDDIRAMTVKGTKDGKEKEVKLSAIADITNAQAYSSIYRANQVRRVRVSAEIADGYNIGLVGNDVKKALESYTPPEGYTVKMAGESEVINEALMDLIKLILLAVVLVYLVMVAQFQSLKSPFIVMFTIPLALTGGMLALGITGMDVSIIAMLGFLVLVGVVVNNGIVFVDCVNMLVGEGMSKTEALVRAGRIRMRPIMMTALTTILGLLTMSFGVGMGAEMVQPMAVVTIGGMMYSTVLTLLVIPVMYDLFNKEKAPKAEEVTE